MTNAAPTRTVALDILSRVRVASPCAVRWEDMEGDDRVRHCAQCNLNVYNFSNMSAEEAAAIVERKEWAGGRLCAGFYRRADGTMIVGDCPVGLRARLQRVGRHTARAVAAVCAALGAWMLLGAGRESRSMSGVEPLATLARWVRPQSLLGQRQTRGQWIAGDICVPPAPVPKAPPGGAGGSTP